MKIQITMQMILCASCKNKTSNEQCSSPALRGLFFCGKHVKMKNPRIWVQINHVVPQVIQIQKVWRGYAVRNRIRLAGTGCLSRKECHNENELVTLEEKTEIHPFDYFSFLENGKLWWFDFRSLHEIFAVNDKPSNPYTRQKISLESRQRFRELCILRKIHDEPLFHHEKTDQNLVGRNWIAISQIIEENGFEDCINPFIFARLSRVGYYSVVNLFLNDLMSLKPTRNRYLLMTKHMIKKIQRMNEIVEISFEVSKAFLSILEDTKDPYSICYIIMSCLYKL